MKTQNHYSNKPLIICSLLIIILSALIILISVKKNSKDIFSIDKINDCNILFSEYLKNEESTIYLNCLNEVKIQNDGEYLSLSKYLEKNDITKVLSHLNLEKTLKDGGTQIYVDDVIKIIKCHTDDGNKDIYIGDKDMNNVAVFENRGCGKNFFTDREFEKVYTLENIIEEENKYTLKFSDDKTNIVSITNNFEKEIINKLKKDKKYIITFENKYGELIQDDIREIFEKCTIKKIVAVK